MIECLREWTGADEYTLEIKRQDGAWDITLSGRLGTGRVVRGRGTGSTFDAAWDGIDPLWA
jgi:hypothetical protein